MDCTDLEVLLDSGAGTGKTFSGMFKARVTAESYPGCIQVFCRQTRKSMSTTILPDWERDVLGEGHPAINGGASLDHRDKYIFPNGSEVWLLGLENIDRILSAKFDRFYIFQAEEVPTPESYEKLLSRLRNGKTPYHQGSLDVNPAGEFHWINRRPEIQICTACVEGRGEDGLPMVVELEDGVCPECSGTLWRPRMTRIRYRPKDNPRWWDVDGDCWTPEGKEYVGLTLGSLTGVQYKRLVLHQWVSEEGQIWEEFDPAIHCISGTIKDDPQRQAKMLHVTGWDDPVELTWFSAAMDFGHRAPGCFQVWGHDRAGRLYMVAEVYKQGWQLDRWAEAICELHQEFKFKRITCDSADGGTGAIGMLNDRISGIQGPVKGGRNPDRGLPRLAMPADKSAGKLHALDVVRWGLTTHEDGKPSLFFLNDSLRFGRDEGLAKAYKPTCTVQEIPSYIWYKSVDGKPDKEAPDPGCVDHGCNTLEYECEWAWKKDLTPKEPEVKFQPGTLGHLMGHDTLLGKKRRGK